MVHYRFYKFPPPVRILSQINKVRVPNLTSLRPILVFSSHQRLGLQSGLFPSGFLTKALYTSLFYPILPTCPANLVRLDFIARKILDEVYRSLSCSICSFLHSPVTSSFLGPNILLSTAPYSQTPSAYDPPSM